MMLGVKQRGPTHDAGSEVPVGAAASMITILGHAEYILCVSPSFQSFNHACVHYSHQHTVVGHVVN
eukprot:scaffold215919_cov28-Tisochrysis_lutea.AAC.2